MASLSEKAQQILDAHVADRNGGKSPDINLSLCYRLIELYDTYRDRPNSLEMQSHDHSIHMVLVKIARIATGTFDEDNYKDIIGYTELAFRAADSFSRQLQAPINR